MLESNTQEVEKLGLQAESFTGAYIDENGVIRLVGIIYTLVLEVFFLSSEVRKAVT